VIVYVCVLVYVPTNIQSYISNIAVKSAYIAKKKNKTKTTSKLGPSKKYK